MRIRSGVSLALKGIFPAAALFVALISTPAPSQAQERSGSFQLTPFDSTPLNEEALRAGIRKLLSNNPDCERTHCANPKRVDEILGRTKGVHALLRQLVDQRLHSPDGGRIPFQDSWTNDGLLGLPFNEYHEIRFPSLFQRPGNHPSNQVVAKYVVPLQIAGCPYDYPTVIFLHGATEDSVDDTIGMAEKFTENNQKVATLHIYFPHYGPRRFLPQGKRDEKGSKTWYDPDEFNLDYIDLFHNGAMRDNILQSILDIHLAIDWVNSIKRTSRPTPISLAGLSMGSALGFLYEGIEPGRVNAADAFYAGGGDLAGAIGNVIRTPRYKDDLFNRVAQERRWDPDQARPLWAEVDPIVWGYRIQDRKMLLINAVYDQVFRRKENHDSLLSVMGADNELEEDWLETEHNPTEGGTSVVYLAYRLFLRMNNYLMDGFESPASVCSMR